MKALHVLAMGFFKYCTVVGIGTVHGYITGKPTDWATLFGVAMAVFFLVQSAEES